MVGDSRGRVLRVLFFALVAMPFLGVFPYMRWLKNPNEHTRTFTTMALVESGEVDITEQVRRYGMVGDLASRPDESTGEDRYYSVKAPLTSWLGVPVYAAFRQIAPTLGLTPPEEAKAREEHERWLEKSTWVLHLEEAKAREDHERWLEKSTWVLRLFAVQLPCFVFLILFERFLRRRTDDPVLRLSAVGAVGLGSNCFAYATMFTSHALFAVAAFGSFVLTTMERERTPDPRARRLGMAFAAALLASACTLLEYHAAIVSLALGIYVVLTFRRPAGVALAALAAGLCLVALLAHQDAAFGHPLATGHKLQVDPGLASHHDRGLNGVGAPNLHALLALTFDPGFGALTSSPFLVLGLLALPLLAVARDDESRRERTTLAVAFVTMLGLFVLSSGITNWRAGWTIGPRYLGAAPPFFAYAAVVALARIGRREARRPLVRALALGGFAASLLVTGSVALLINTLPETISRPMTQFAAPMWRAGFSPHHLLELTGVDAVWPFRLMAAAAVLSFFVALLSAMWPGEPRRLRVLLLSALFGGAALTPALVPPPEGSEAAAWEGVALLARRWEPADRDRISALEGALERGERDPCGYFELAHWKRSVGMIPEAERARRQAEQRCDPGE